MVCFMAQVIPTKEQLKKSSRVNFTQTDPGTKDEVIYKLFTKDNLRKPILVNDETIINHIKDKHIPMVLLIHGWTTDDTSPWYDPLRDAYLESGPHNIIYINWSRAGNLTYAISCANVIPVGQYIAKFLTVTGVDAKRIHLIGHSLGSQLSSYIAKAYLQWTGLKIGRITAVDPAGPKWERTDVRKDERLSEDDAEFVDITHTDVSYYGYAAPIGHVDFYPNGGVQQPGCPDEEQKENCNHHRSTWLFLESVRTTVEAREAEYLDEGNYNVTINVKPKGKVVTYGQHVDQKAKGIFYFETNGRKPFLKTLR
ncbi:lipase member H-like isoform X2 [Cylas formicarius]|uniref:lipase member H-like isoform X2 n=1 Tax=Cylas formicarius TaxID=197179 RepID=UPI002958C431|nr:lipase member H-like isoform X2 [Cylas formicarius]